MQNAQLAIRLYGPQPGNPARHFTGLVVVVIIHAAIMGAALYGLNRTGSRLAPPADLEWVPIVAPTPPPPQQLPRDEAVRLTKQPLHMLTPPDFTIELPAQSGESISVPPADGMKAATGPLDSAVESITHSATLGTACPNAQDVRATMRFPAQARREGLQGNVLARFIVGAGGNIRDVEIISSSHRAFNGAVAEAVRQFECVGQGRDVTVEVPFSFRLE